MSVSVEWYRADRLRATVYPPHPDASGDHPGLGLGAAIEGDWVGHDAQGPTDYALVFSTDECTAIHGTLDQLAAFADRIRAAVDAAVRDAAQEEET